MKFSLFFFLILTFSFSLEASPRSSETTRAQKGLIHLLSADILEQHEYHFRTSFEYTREDDLHKDGRIVSGSTGTLGFGYALTPHIHLSAHGGIRSATQDDPQFQQTTSFFSFGSAITASYDVGHEFLDLQKARLTVGSSLWVDFSNIQRFFSGVHIAPRAIISSDFSDFELFPFRLHGNFGFRTANRDRYFSEDEVETVGPIDRFATQTIDSHAILAGAGIEIPYSVFTPSLELHLEHVMDAGFSKSPKWATLGFKGNPFPQRNIEIFSAVDFGFSSFSPVGNNEKLDAYATPLWNITVGFGLSQFGRREGVVGIEAVELEQLQDNLSRREDLLSSLREDLRYNTIQGRVIDADTGEPLEAVEVTFPDESELEPTQTNSEGEFRQFLAEFPGGRVQFLKEGYQSSSQYLSLDPGENVSLDIELQEGEEIPSGNLVVNVSNEEGNPIEARVRVHNLDRQESFDIELDDEGQGSIELPAADYGVEIQAAGYEPLRRRIKVQEGRAILRSFTLKSLQ